MGRVAIFVDAGYLFAQGSKALTGENKARATLRLNETAALAELKDVASAKAAECGLLRVYWYDGVISFKGPTLEQERLAHTDNVKLRLGFINSIGEQKGVDSLIVTDLIDLARNHAMSDAILLSGDEDVRIGVQIAQQFGVRVHLIGIAPANKSQSKTLQQEADTTVEWGIDVIAKFLSLAPAPMPVAPAPAQPATPGSATPEKMPAKSAKTAPSLTSDVEKVILEFVLTFDTAELNSLRTHWERSAGIPPEYDGRLLARCRAVLKRELETDEKKLARAKFKADVRAQK